MTAPAADLTGLLERMGRLAGDVGPVLAPAGPDDCTTRRAVARTVKTAAASTRLRSAAVKVVVMAGSWSATGGSGLAGVLTGGPPIP